jgi:3D (Asp-Asp-Asp) domain-containing protein
MKHLQLLCLCLGFAALLPSTMQAARTTSNSPFDVAAGQQLSVRTTAYSPNEPGSNRSAVDTNLTYGGKVYSAASDWSWLPLGTVFRMKETGRVYRIEDYGSALVGRQTIDLYMPTDRLMNSWGVKQVDIEILEFGSFEKSLALLQTRMGNSHVRKMVAALRMQQSPKVLVAFTRIVRD